MKEFRPGDMFGHEEIYDGCKRRCTVRAVKESELLYMNLKEFKRYFGSQALEHKLFKFFPRVDEEDIKNKIIEHDMVRKKNSEAIMEACNLNCFSKTSSRFFIPEDKKIQKLGFILDKAKKKLCLTEDEKLEHEKIKLVDITSQFLGK